MQPGIRFVAEQRSVRDVLIATPQLLPNAFEACQAIRINKGLTFAWPQRGRMSLRSAGILGFGLAFLAATKRRGLAMLLSAHLVEFAA